MNDVSVVKSADNYRVYSIKSSSGSSICSICGEKFDKRTWNNNKCGNCFIEIKCSKCGKWFKSKRSSAALIDRLQKEDIICCSYACSNYYRGLQTGRQNGIKYGSKNLAKWLKTKEGKNHIKRIAISNANKFRKSESFIEHNRRLANSERNKRHLNNLNNTFWKSERGKALKRQIVKSMHKPEIKEKAKLGAKRWRESEEGRKFYKRHNKEIIWGSEGREAFYRKKLELVSFNNEFQQISLDDIDELAGVPGVWAKFSIKDGKEVCLDVSGTEDIGKEMLWSIRAIEKGRQNQGLNDSQIERKYKNPGIYKKYRDISKFESITFKLVAIGIDERKDRYLIEAQFAHDNQALFWSPAPGQIAIINEICKGE